MYCVMKPGCTFMHIKITYIMCKLPKSISLHFVFCEANKSIGDFQKSAFTNTHSFDLFIWNISVFLYMVFNYNVNFKIFLCSCVIFIHCPIGKIYEIHNIFMIIKS